MKNKKEIIKKIIKFRDVEYEVKKWKVELGTEEVDMSGSSLPNTETEVFIDKILIEIGRKKPKKRRK